MPIFEYCSLLLLLSVNIEELSFRKATPLDKNTVLSLRYNVYGGLDYLADYYDYFMQDRNRQCFVGELDGKVVSIFLKNKSSVKNERRREYIGEDRCRNKNKRNH